MQRGQYYKVIKPATNKTVFKLIKAGDYNQPKPKLPLLSWLPVLSATFPTELAISPSLFTESCEAADSVAV